MKNRRCREEGYENKNVVMRRGKDGAFAFLYFSVIFGAVVYLIATVLWKSLFTLPKTAFGFIF